MRGIPIFWISVPVVSYLPHKPTIWQGQKAMEACWAQGYNNKLRVYRTKYSLLFLLFSTQKLIISWSLISSWGLECPLFPLLGIQFILLYIAEVPSHSLRKSPPSSIVIGKECLIIGKERSKYREIEETLPVTSCVRAHRTICHPVGFLGCLKGCIGLLQITIFITFIRV